MKTILALFFGLIASTARGEMAPLQAGDAAPLLGHNLTPTSYTLPQGRATVGTYAVGYGITDRLTVATSPWFIVGYNMPLVSAKYAFGGDELVQQFSIDAIYFRTFHYGLDRYTQESFFGRFTGSHRFNPIYTLHFSVGYQYFLNDDRPYSLRLTPGNRDRYNLSTSLLNEVHLFRHGGAMLEGGVLGLNYVASYLHLGLSAFYQWDWGYLQLGLSKSTSFSDGNDWMVHPEVQLQTFF